MQRSTREPIAEVRADGRSNSRRVTPDRSKDTLGIAGDSLGGCDKHAQWLGAPNEPRSIRLFHDPLCSCQVGRHKKQGGETVVVAPMASRN
jgi:hypothetical protein